MRLRIPYWPQRRIVIEVKLERVAPLAEYHKSLYEQACDELVEDDDGDRIQTKDERR